MEIIQNFNGLELIFILILAILLFGPEKIPEIAARLGSFVRSIRTFSDQMMAEWRQETGLGDNQEARDLTASLNQTVTDVRSTMQSLRSPLDTVKRSLQEPPGGAETGRPPQAPLPGGTPSQQDREQLEKKLTALENQLSELRSELARRESGQKDRPDE